MATKEWKQSINGQTFLISTARDLPHEFVQQAFDNPAMYWAKPISAANMKTLLDNSCTLGLYKLINGDERTPVGMARMITDYVTLAYLTDVYLADEYRSLGLGRWMIHCCREIVQEIPELRFMILLTGSEQAQQLYRRELGMKVMGTEETLAAMGARKAWIPGS
ncbi:acetyltransferase [Trematosphaeria pertusa]|uniref:Acetyltransferase n=1 Tax=Trematosphaeria pertusa TaxID=390896 RepID=A0A6A6IJ50_9PLEO|nr:acetyltransferase [Trematosphaeria pertusa]KAF2250207.1 acetyltransferase [Trematosphaeria pertusa]